MSEASSLPQLTLAEIIATEPGGYAGFARKVNMNRGDISRIAKLEAGFGPDTAAALKAADARFSIEKQMLALAAARAKAKAARSAA